MVGGGLCVEGCWKVARVGLELDPPNEASAFASKAAAPPSKPRVVAVVRTTSCSGTVVHDVPAGHAVHAESSK